MKKAWLFLLNYKLFSLVMVAGLVALTLELSGARTASHGLLILVVISVTMPLVWSMWQDLRVGKYGIDILAVTSIVTAVILGEYWAALVVVLILTGGEVIENFAEHRARAELGALLSHAPKNAHVIRKGKPVNVKVGEIRVGEKVFIRAGEQVPVDAVILEGSANFDESFLTGESVPQPKEMGFELLSGSISLDGAVTAKAISTAENSHYQHIIKLVEGAAKSQAPFVRLADRLSLPFTFFAFAFASAVWLFTGDAERFLQVIIVATPCPLLLAAPIALVSGMSRASRYGIIVKTGSALERLAEAKTIAFDKTGTLTHGVLKVKSIKTYNGFKQDQILSIAGSLEQSSNHLIAKAIQHAAKDNGVKITKARHVQEMSGRGLKATLGGEEILVGNLKFLAAEDITIPSSHNPQNINNTAVYVAVGGKLAGIISLKDRVRPEAEETIGRLHRLGVKNALMVTGDNDATAQAIAKQLGLDQVHAEALPADKLCVIDSVKQRPVVFVGDGTNDAPVLTGADVGIAMGAHGSAAASESADLVIMTDSVSKVVGAYAIAKRTFQIAKQSIYIGIGLSVVLMTVFATGKFTPLTGALLQEVVDVVVVFNALRAHLITIGE